jgi:hypothetical protein
MKLRPLLASLLVGITFAGVQWGLVFADHSSDDWFIGTPYRVAVVFAVPGIFTAAAASGNMHSFSTVVAVLANFIFYALTTYRSISWWNWVAVAIRGRRSA